MSDFRSHKAAADKRLPTPAWSRLDLEPNRRHRNEFGEYRVTLSGRPCHFVAAVHYREGPHFTIRECIGSVLDKGRGDPVAEAGNWQACARRFAEHWQTECEDMRRQEAAIAFARECIDQAPR